MTTLQHIAILIVLIIAFGYAISLARRTHT